MSNTAIKKKSKLGMNISTANARLQRDLLYALVVKTGQNACYRCGREMTRETFSIEHKVGWLNSDDPVGLYFNLDNISYSHLGCNSRVTSRRGYLRPGETPR